MVERRYYRVAEHVFLLSLEESFFEQLPNYTPFRCEETTPLFSVSTDQIAVSQLKHVHTDIQGEDMPRIEMYRSDEDWLIKMSRTAAEPVCVQLLISNDFSHVSLQIEDCNLFRFALDNAVMLTYAFATAPFMTLEMHSSVTCLDNRGYLFLGISGTGKSTHSRMWKEAFPAATLLNDDNPVLRVINNEVRVYGSPWSGKTPCYVNDCAPVGAIVKITQAPENKATVLSLPVAYAYMLASSSGLKFIPEVMDALYNTIVSVIQSVGLYEMRCLPNSDAARVCHAAVTATSPNR